MASLPLCCLLALLASLPSVAFGGDQRTQDKDRVIQARDQTTQAEDKDKATHDRDQATQADLAKDRGGEFDPFDYAAMTELKAFLSRGDTGLVLDTLGEEYQGFKELEDKVHFLEATMEEHGERRVVAGKAVEEAGALLQDIDLKVLQVFEEELAGLKLEVERTPLVFSQEVVQRIADVVQEAEIFLQLSKVRLEQVAKEEVEMVAAEATADQQWIEAWIVNQTQGMDANQKVVYRMKMQRQWGEELRRKLEGGVEGAAPVGRGEVARVEGQRWMGGRRKDKEVAKESARKKPKNTTKSTIAEEKEKERLKAVAEIREATKELARELEQEELELKLEQELALEEAAMAVKENEGVVEGEMEKERILPPSSSQHHGYSPPHLALALMPLAILILAALLFAIVGKEPFVTRRRLFEASNPGEGANQHQQGPASVQVDANKVSQAGPSSWPALAPGWSPFHPSRSSPRGPTGVRADKEK